MLIAITNKELQDLIVRDNLSEETLNEVLLSALKNQMAILESEKRIKEMMLSVANVILSEIEDTKQIQLIQSSPVAVETTTIREVQTVKEIRFDPNMITVDNTVKSSPKEIEEKKKGWIM